MSAGFAAAPSPRQRQRGVPVSAACQLRVHSGGFGVILAPKENRDALLCVGSVSIAESNLSFEAGDFGTRGGNFSSSCLQGVCFCLV